MSDEEKKEGHGGGRSVRLSATVKKRSCWYFLNAQAGGSATTPVGVAEKTW